MHILLSTVRVFITGSLFVLFSIHCTSAIAGESCTYDILGVKPGMEKGSVRSLMLKQGFREVPLGRNGGMAFTNKKIWPPEGVILNRKQEALLRSPKQRLAAEKRAETDPAYKKLLESIKDIPPEPNDMSIYISIGGVNKNSPDGAPIRGVYARYSFPSDVYSTVPVYSPEHKSLSDSRWKKYCGDIDMNALPDKRYAGEDGGYTRVCENRSDSGGPLTIMIYPLSRSDTRGCRYKYLSSPKEATEELM